MDIEKIFLARESELKAEIAKYTNCPDIVDDTYQEAYLKVYKYKVDGRKFYGTENSIRYLLRIMVRNMMLDKKRRKTTSREVTTDKSIEVRDSVNPEKLMIDVEEELDHNYVNKKLNKAFKKMTHDTYMTYKLRMKGFKFKDIAYLTDTGLNTAQGRMRYAIDKIESEFND
jgi:RNA polymerase sigma factor (sigma-70 family)